MQKLTIGSLLTILILCFTFSACNNKVYNLSELPQKFITVGSSGGFAGAESNFFLFPNGQRILKDKFKGEVALPKLEGSAFKSIFKTLLKGEFMALDLNKPGNMNYFIEMHNKGESHKVLWSSPDQVPKELLEIFKTVTNIPNPTKE